MNLLAAIDAETVLQLGLVVITFANTWLIVLANSRIARINQLETKLEESAKQIITAQLAIEREQRKSEVASVAQRVAMLEVFRTENAKDTKAIVEALSKFELVIEQRLSRLSVEIAREMATKEDLSELAKELREALKS